jgi:hypothetical protein
MSVFHMTYLLFYILSLPLLGNTVTLYFWNTGVTSQLVSETKLLMKSSVFWDITLCSHWKSANILKEHIQVTSRALLHSGFGLGLFFNPGDLGDMFLCNVVDFQQTTWHYIPEDRTLHNHCCENLKSHKTT